MLDSITSAIPSIFSWRQPTTQAVVDGSRLESALQTGDLTQVQALIQGESGESIDLSKPLPSGQLPLSAAIRLGHSEIATYLAKQGANPSQLDSDQMSAIDYAILSQNRLLIDALLPSQLREAATQERIAAQAFTFASQSDVQAMQSQIQSLEEITREASFDPDQGAIEKLRAAVVGNKVGEILPAIAKGAEITPQLLALALFHQNVDVVKALLSKVGDKKTLISSNLNPLPFNLLHIAAYTQNLDLVQLFIQEGGNLYSREASPVAPADILLSRASKKDPLAIQQSQLALATINTISLGVSLSAGTLVSMQTFGLSMLIATSLTRGAADYALNQNAFAECSLTGFLGHYLGTLAHTLGAFTAQLNPVTKLLYNYWSIYRLGKVAYRSLSGIKKAYTQFSYDSYKSVKHAAMQTATLATSVLNYRDIIKSLAADISYATSSAFSALSTAFEKSPEPVASPTVEEELPPQDFANAYYFVNLDKSTDRRDHMIAKCSEVGIECTRHPAVYGKDYGKTGLEKLIAEKTYKPHPQWNAWWLNPAEIGCALSHYTLWNKIQKEGHEVTVVMEDDVGIPADFTSQIQQTLEHAPKDWDLIYLGCNANQPGSFFDSCKAENLEQTPDGRFTILDTECTAGNWGYMIRQKAAQELVSSFLPIERPADYMMKEKFIEGGRLNLEYGNKPLKMYCANPEILTTNLGLGSTIDGTGSVQRGRCEDIYCGMA